MKSQKKSDRSSTLASEVRRPPLPDSLHAGIKRKKLKKIIFL